MAIEIGIVEPPYILDFGKVSLDVAPDFEDSTIEQEDATHEELYGAERWQTVVQLLEILKWRFGIYYLDPKPGNIMFANDD
ncbi:MAG TPA: hypothetical protein VHY91_25610 [Pirellulales bacterium]|jgi:hypothetical protein|nr:hypothetical protein [Pirellulales bacterium]